MCVKGAVSHVLYVPNSTKIRLKTNAHNYIVHGFYINFIGIYNGIVKAPTNPSNFHIEPTSATVIL